MTSKAKIEPDSIQLADLNFNQGKYHLQVIFKRGQSIMSQNTFNIAGKELKFKRVSYQLTDTYVSESEKDSIASYPNQLKFTDTATDGNYLHLEVE